MPRVDAGRNVRSRPRKRPAPAAPNFPRAVPARPGAVTRPVWHPTATQRRSSRAAQRGYVSQGGAVRRAAIVQQRLGPGFAVRPPKHGQVLRAKDITRYQRKPTTQARLRERQYGSQARAVEKVANRQRAAARAKKLKSAKAIYLTDPKELKAAGFAPPGTGEAIASSPKYLLKALSNVPRDLGETAVGVPTSLVHMGVTQAHGVSKSIKTRSPKPFLKAEYETGKALVQPYVDLYHDPVKFATEHPVTTALMIDPAAKVPGRAVGRVARLTGRQTLERPTATLPGTAMAEKRIGSRDYFKRRRQERADRGESSRSLILRRGTAPTHPHVTAKELKRRVDEHADLEQHYMQEAVHKALKQSHKATKGQPKDVRAQHAADAVEAAKEQARVDAQARFAHTFGANVTPELGAATVKQAAAVRKAAAKAEAAAKKSRKQAKKAHAQALADARAARGRTPVRPDTSALQVERRGAQAELVGAQRAAAEAEAGLQRAHAGARVSVAKPKSSPLLEELHGQRRNVQRAAVTDEVAAARKTVSAADRDVAKIKRELQRAEQEGARRVGVTEGRFSSGRMTMVAGRRVADQAEHISNLRGALHEVRQAAAKAREELKQAEHRGRREVRAHAQGINQQIRAERQRIAGVAPAEHESLLNALTTREAAPARVRAARARVREVDAQIAAKTAAERERVAGVPPTQADALLRSIHDLDAAQAEHAAAREAHAAAREQHIATSKAHKQSPLVDPTAQGRLFEHERDAKTVVRQLNAEARRIPTGNRLPFQLDVREPGGTGRPVSAVRGAGTEPLTFRVKKVGEDQWAALPKIASQRMYGGGGKTAELSHASVGTSKSTGAKVMRNSRRAFTQATLPLSFKWLTGQGVEAVIRSVVAGAGPADLVRFNRIVKRMNDDIPGSGDAFSKRVLGGQLGKTGAVAEQLRGSGRTLGEEFQGTPLRAPAALGTLVGDTAALRTVRTGFGRYTRGVVGAVNQFFENTARKAMAGQAVRQGPLMEQRLHGLTDRAIKDAADGLHGTEAQVQAARAVDQMYGRYSKWSPEMRSLLLHWTPFLPWYLNTAKFLAYELPVRHPLKTSLLASANQAEQEWRKSERLSFYGKNHRPGFLMGGYPSKGGGVYRVGHYTPWGIGPDVGEAVADLVLPQMLGPVKNLAGVDWKWQRLRNQDRTEFGLGEKAARAGTTLLETHVPALSQIGSLTGLTPRYIDRRKDVGDVKTRAKRLLPTTPTAPPPPPKKRKRKSGSTDILGGGGGASVDILK